MIHLFKSGRRILFFPIGFANSVAKWIFGVHSSDGSIIIKNTANPTEDKSLDLRVNDRKIMRQVREHLEGRSLSKSEIIRIQEIVHALLDGISLKWHDKSFSVDADWIADIVKKNMIDKPGEEGEEGEETELPTTGERVIYFGIHKPVGTYNLHGTPVTIKVEKGLITKWEEGSVTDLTTLTS